MWLKVDSYSDLFGPLLEHRHGILWLSDGEGGDSRLQTQKCSITKRITHSDWNSYSLLMWTDLVDARFVPGDLFDGVSQNISVVYVQEGDATHPRPPVETRRGHSDDRGCTLSMAADINSKKYYKMARWKNQLHPHPTHTTIRKNWSYINEKCK